jgi:SAM-dependent methyltransferase
MSTPSPTVAGARKGPASRPTPQAIRGTLLELARQYPPDMADGQARDAERIAYHIELVAAGPNFPGRIADVGGGVGLFSVGCAALGMDSWLVDDFGDEINRQQGDGPLAVHRKHGVHVVKRNVVAEGLDFEPESFDVITSFDSMEHWHQSPKALFAQIRRLLKPGGLFVLGVPNCVSLRKRISVPLGVGKWSDMKYWYEEPFFRGHVREPDVDDLHYIARDMKLENVRITGRNWLGYYSRFGLVRALTPAADLPLRWFPSLCSDIYLVANKPAASA